MAMEAALPSRGWPDALGIVSYTVNHAIHLPTASSQLRYR